MKFRKYHNFGFILDAIDLMPKTKVPKWVRALDALAAFLITTLWAFLLYTLYQWLRKL